MVGTVYVNPARHGSLQNAIADQTRSKVPEVGMGVTEDMLVMFSDRHPYTVVRILTPRRIAVTADEAVRVDDRGESDWQEYRYASVMGAPEVVLFLNKHGKWKRSGDADGSTFLVGRREKYYDFSR